MLFSLSSSFVFAQTLSRLTLSSGVNPSTYGSSLTLTATVSPTAATGTVTFTDGSTVLGTASLASGVAVLKTASLSVGVHTLIAVYKGDANTLPATSDKLAQTVKKSVTGIKLTSSPNPSVFGNSVTFTATITPSTTAGNVTFFDGSIPLDTSVILAGSIATFTTSSLALGSHSIKASFGGTSTLSGATSAVLSQKVNATGTLRKDTSMTVSSGTNPSMYGNSVTLRATVSPSAATGNVTFYDGSKVLGIAGLSGGAAAFSIASLAGGSHGIFAMYNGDSVYRSSTSNVMKQTVNGNGAVVSPTITPTGCAEAASAQFMAMSSAIDAYIAAERAAWQTWSTAVKTAASNGAASPQAALRAAQVSLTRSLNQSRQQYVKAQKNAQSTVQTACRNLR
jgi:hypothetical protein